MSLEVALLDHVRSHVKFCHALEKTIFEQIRISP